VLSNIGHCWPPGVTRVTVCPLMATVAALSWEQRGATVGDVFAKGDRVAASAAAASPSAMRSHMADGQCREAWKAFAPQASDQESNGALTVAPSHDIGGITLARRSATASRRPSRASAF